MKKKSIIMLSLIILLISLSLMILVACKKNEDKPVEEKKDTKIIAETMKNKILESIFPEVEIYNGLDIKADVEINSNFDEGTHQARELNQRHITINGYQLICDRNDESNDNTIWLELKDKSAYKNFAYFYDGNQIFVNDLSDVSTKHKANALNYKAILGKIGDQPLSWTRVHPERRWQYTDALGAHDKKVSDYRSMLSNKMTEFYNLLNMVFNNIIPIDINALNLEDSMLDKDSYYKSYGKDISDVYIKTSIIQADGMDILPLYFIPDYEIFKKEIKEITLEIMFFGKDNKTADFSLHDKNDVKEYKAGDVVFKYNFTLNRNNKDVKKSTVVKVKDIKNIVTESNKNLSEQKEYIANKTVGFTKEKYLIENASKIELKRVEDESKGYDILINSRINPMALFEYVNSEKKEENAAKLITFDTIYATDFDKMDLMFNINIVNRKTLANEISISYNPKEYRSHNTYVAFSKEFLRQIFRNAKINNFEKILLESENVNDNYVIAFDTNIYLQLLPTFELKGGIELLSLTYLFGKDKINAIGYSITRLLSGLEILNRTINIKNGKELQLDLTELKRIVRNSEYSKQLDSGLYRIISLLDGDKFNIITTKLDSISEISNDNVLAAAKVKNYFHSLEEINGIFDENNKKKYGLSEIKTIDAQDAYRIESYEDLKNNLLKNLENRKVKYTYKDGNGNTKTATTIISSVVNRDYSTHYDITLFLSPLGSQTITNITENLYFDLLQHVDVDEQKDIFSSYKYTFRVYTDKQYKLYLKNKINKAINSAKHTDIYRAKEKYTVDSFDNYMEKYNILNDMLKLDKLFEETIDIAINNYVVAAKALVLK